MNDIINCLCGGRAKLWKDGSPNHVVRCTKCMRFGDVMGTAEAAIVEWNNVQRDMRRVRGED